MRISASRSARSAWSFSSSGSLGTGAARGPPERIALLHGESRDDPNAFESVLTFEPAGEQTRIVMRAVFPTKELRDEAVEKYHAIESGEQTLRNLAAYVTEVAQERSTVHGPATVGETMTEQETGQEGTVR
jgi:hypothetical protein